MLSFCQLLAKVGDRLEDCGVSSQHRFHSKTPNCLSVCALALTTHAGAGFECHGAVEVALPLCPWKASSTANKSTVQSREVLNQRSNAWEKKHVVLVVLFLHFSQDLQVF